MEQTIKEKVCQSCGMPMAAIEHFGTNTNGSPCTDYCCFCFQQGGFTHNMSMEQTIENSVSYMDGSEKTNGHTLTKSEAALKMYIQLPTLKRWASHEITHQEYFTAINRAVDYINEHLSESINLYDLAGVANISGFHFHRIFKALMNESPGEYIQRLRLEKAIFKLQTTQQTLTEIAEQTGYQSPHALSKAFKKRFGVSPSIFHAQPSDLTVPIDEPVFLPVNPEFKELTPKEVIIVRVINPFQEENAYIHAWQKLIRFMNVNGIPDETHEYISLSRDISTITQPDHCRKYVCITANPGIKPKGEFGKQTIAGGLYAVFTYQGAYKNLESLYCSIYRNWIPNSNYELRDAAFFEKYLNTPDVVSQDELLTEVYIPVSQCRRTNLLSPVK
ncbi:MAG: Zinc finger protein [Bacteroidetes bacterium]|nr:Zinc finger protein [Bacteroidota bacterium]